MFYAEIKKPVCLKREQHEPYADIHQKFGVNYGVHLIKNGRIKGEKGEAHYWHYFNLFKPLPTFMAHWDDTSPITTEGDKDFITIDLYMENGLLFEEEVTVQLHEINHLSDKEDGVYLLLCSRDESYFQIITQ